MQIHFLYYFESDFSIKHLHGRNKLVDILYHQSEGVYQLRNNNQNHKREQTDHQVKCQNQTDGASRRPHLPALNPVITKKLRLYEFHGKIQHERDCRTDQERRKNTQNKGNELDNSIDMYHSSQFIPVPVPNDLLSPTAP